MSTTRIQLKRADSMSTLNAIVLAKGEPAIYFNDNTSGVLYIGNGVTSPGLQFATSGSSVTQHKIADTTSIGPSHTIVATHLGSVLTSIDTDDAKMKRLGFYDLGPASPLTSGLNALGISDILYSGSDSTGIGSRWHWMNTTHVGNKRSIFFTEADYANVGNGSGSGVGNMEHSSVTNADTEIGYQLKSLSYDITSLVDTTGGIMALVAKKSGANNVLQFKRIGSEDLTGDLSVHAITSVSHTGTASSVYHTPAASTSIVALSYAAAVNGSVLKKSSSGVLHFAKLGYADITGVFHIPGDYSGQEAFTLRYDGTGVNGWEACNFIRSVVNSNYTINHISNAALAGRTPSLFIKDYDNDYLSSLEMMILKGTQADLNSYAANKIVISSGRDASTTNRDILFYTRTGRTTDNPPNLWLRADGSLWVNSVDVTSGSPSNFPTDIDDMNRALYVYPKKMGRISSSSASYPGWAGLEIGELRHTQAIDTASNTNGINGIKIGNIISSSVGSATVNSHHNLYFLNCGNLTTPANVTGIQMGSLSSGAKPSASATGISITSVSSQNTGIAKGLEIGSIVSDTAYGTSYGVSLTSINSGNISVGIKSNSIRSYLDSYGMLSDLITSSSLTKGISFTSIDSTGSFSELSLIGEDLPTAIGFEAKSISSTYHSIGMNLQNVDATFKKVGLFIGISNTTKTIDDVAGSSVAIYTTGGTHIFGGAVSIDGITTINGPTIVDEGYILTVLGITDATSLIVANGDIRVTNGYFSGTHKGNVISTSISTGQTALATTTLYTDSQIQKLSFIKFTTATTTGVPIYRIGRGFNGQIIHISFQYNGNVNSYVKIIKDDNFGPTDCYSDFEFKDGAYDLFDHQLDLSHEEAYSFICEYIGVGGHPGTDWQTGQKYKWKLLQNM